MSAVEELAQLQTAVAEATACREALQRKRDYERFFGANIDEVKALEKYMHDIEYHVHGADEAAERALQRDVAARIASDPDIALEPIQGGFKLVSRKASRELDEAINTERRAGFALHNFEQTHRDELAAIAAERERHSFREALESGDAALVRHALGLTGKALTTADLQGGAPGKGSLRPNGDRILNVG